MFTAGFPTQSGRASFHAVQHGSPDETPDVQYPLYLTTGRLLAQYQSGTQTRRVPELVGMSSEPLAEIHPSTAKKFRVADGQRIVLATRRGQAEFNVKTTPTIREDTVFIPFHWSGIRAANRLTNPALDPVSRMPEFKVCAVRIEVPDQIGAKIG
jgi:assimilatory nitrate reductase catalytic subunit